MENEDKGSKKKEKRLRKRTLKKRIFSLISLSNSLIILILGVAIFLGALAFIKGSAITMSYFISSNIVKDMSSPSFLEEMSIKNLEGLSYDSKEFKNWTYTIDKTLGIDFSSRIEDHIGFTPEQKKQRERLLMELEEFEEEDNKIYKDLENKKLSDFDIYYAITSIEIKDKTIYLTGQAEYGDIENYLDNLRGWNWLRRQIAETVVEVPIIDQNGKEIGTVTTCLNDKLLTIIIAVLLIGIVFFSAIIFIISKVITRIFAIPILNPLKELQYKMDEIAKEEIGQDFGKPITFKKPFYEIEKLANSTNIIICKMKEYTELLHEQRDEMEAQRDELESQKEELEILTTRLGSTNEDLEQKNNQLENIFNNVSQGFLTFDLDLKIRQEYSFECKRIFKEDIENKYFPKLLFPDDSEQIKFLDNILKEILQEEDSKKIELYIPLLPTEVLIHDRYIHISYKLVTDIMASSGKSFMLMLTDITEKKALKRQWNEERRLLRMVVKAISNQDTFLQLLEEFNNFIKSILHCTLINEKSFDECYSEIYRQIHTFKGNFSQYDMHDLVSNLHELESSLAKEKENLREKGINALKDFIFKKNLADLLIKDLRILEEYLGKDFFHEKDIIKIRKQKILEIEKQITTLLPKYEQKQLLTEIRRLRYKPIKELLKAYTEYVVKLSQRLGKEVKPFEISGHDVSLDPDYYGEFIKSLVHVFRNCVDHGIEDPEERYMKGKSEIGVIMCEVTNQNDTVEIIISDDGRGIDLDTIRHKLTEHNLYSNKEVEDLDEDALLKIIFMDEITTGKKLTEISGRGVGLAAVKNELDKIKGTVKVITEKGKGTSFIFTLPLNKKDDSETETVCAETIINSLTETAKEYIEQQTSVELHSVYDGYRKVDKIKLNRLTALINVKGAFNVVFALSINEILAKKLAKCFVIDKLTPEEEQECIDDVIAESSNIILGNSIKVFDDMEYIVNIGSPTILCYQGAVIKNIGSSMITKTLEKDEYKLSLSIISMDNNMIEEEIQWHVS